MGHMPPALGEPLGGLEEEVSKDAKTPETRVPATGGLPLGVFVEMHGCMTDETRESPFYHNILTWQIHLITSLPILDSSLPILHNIRDLWKPNIYHSSITRWWFFQCFLEFSLHPDPRGKKIPIWRLAHIFSEGWTFNHQLFFYWLGQIKQ